MTNFLSLVVFSAMLASGQILFKRIGMTMHGQPLLQGFVSVARMPVLYGALGLYGAATVLWIWILSRIPLSQAYPWVAVGTVTVPVLAMLILHERVGTAYWLGMPLVVAGVFLTQYGARGP